jgi:phosphoglycolate phosphatase
MSRGPCRAALFDLDGTLLDTLQDLADSANRSLLRMGFPPHPVQDYRYFVGEGVAVLARRVLPADRQDPATVQALKSLFNEHYGQHWADNTRPYEGVPALLDALSARGIPLAILSNKPHPFTQAMVAHFFRPWNFAAALGARESHPRKPDPAAALEICAGLGLEAAEVLYAGDTRTDMQTARSAGMFAVGVLWGFRPREELLENGAQALVARPEELLAFF